MLREWEQLRRTEQNVMEQLVCVCFKWMLRHPQVCHNKMLCFCNQSYQRDQNEVFWTGNVSMLAFSSGATEANCTCESPLHYLKGVPGRNTQRCFKLLKSKSHKEAAVRIRLIGCFSVTDCENWFWERDTVSVSTCRQSGFYNENTQWAACLTVRPSAVTAPLSVSLSLSLFSFHL